MVPGLTDHLSGIPIGWFSVMEVAVELIGPFLVGAQQLWTSQTKEKFGMLRRYASVTGARKRRVVADYESREYRSWSREQTFIRVAAVDGTGCELRFELTALSFALNLAERATA